MAEERLEIILEADVTRATANIDKFSNSLAKTVPAAAAKASAGIDKMGKSVANANPALVNFGRVIQDAPFGIIGIANNIDPLLSSLQSLGKQSGGAGNALKALGGALLGPAGIAIGVSAVTSALVAFGPEISAAISGLTKFDAAAREAGAESAKAFIKATDEFAGFARIINDTTASTERQQIALNEANSALGKYGLQIKSVADFQAAGNQVGIVYAKIKQQEARSNIFAAKAAEEYAKGIALGIALEQGDVLGAASNVSVGGLIKTLLGGANAAGVFGIEVGKSFGKINDDQKRFEEEAAKSNKEIDNLVLTLGKVPGVSQKVSSASQQRTQSLKAEQVEIGKITKATQGLILADQSLLNLSKLASEQGKKNEAKSLAEKLKAIQGKDQQPFKQPDKAQSLIPIPTQEELTRLSALDEAMTVLKANVDGIVESGFGSLIDGVFATLENGGNLFENLAQGVKGFVLELAKAVIKAIALQAIMKLLGFASGGAGGGIAGALGGLLGGRAGGGAVSAGGGYIVGEKGPEKFYPSTPGTIVPNDAGNMAGQFEFVISGNTLRAINRRANTSFGRLSG